MKLSSFPTILALATLAVTGGLQAQTVSVDFNSAATDFTGNFTVSTATTTAFAWTNNVGVSGGGGVTVSSDTGGANYNYNTAYSLVAGDTVVISTFFKTNATTGTSANQVAGVGLLGTVTDEFAAASRFVGVTLRQGTASTANLSLALTNNVSGTQNNTLQGAVFTPATNTWYKLTATLTKTATADQFSVAASVENWGATGASFGSTTASFTAQTVTNATLYADTSVFGGFFARQTFGNPIQIAAVDNFALAIPEPSAFALLAGFGALGLVTTRRRRRV